MANDTITMYDYILEEKNVLADSIEKGREIWAEVAEILSSRTIDETIICGSGTSYHAGFATRTFIEEVTGIRTRAEYPSIFVDQQKIYSKNTLFLGVSQGGNSISTMQAVKKAKEGGLITVGISENTEARIFEFSDYKVLMNCGSELSVAKTKGYIVSLAILFLFGMEYARALGKLDASGYHSYKEDLRETAANYDQIIKRGTEWVQCISAELLKARRIVVLGYENNYATTLEGALKLLECMRFGVYGYEIEEFCHGIYNSINDKTHLIYIAPPGNRQERIPVICNLMQQTTAHQYVIFNEMEGYHASEKDCQIQFVDHKYFNVLEYIIPIQIIASKLPYKLGIDPFLASDTKFHQKAGSK